MTLIVKPGFNGMTDADAIAYVNAVEAADGQLLEFGVGKAINDFVVGCKLDNTWSAIKASCILAGARTLAGALVPLAGTAPTNVGPFVSGDYNRKTGLVGNGTSKYLDSNRSNNADPQNSRHMVVSVSNRQTNSALYITTSTTLNGSGDSYLFQSADFTSNTVKLSQGGTPAPLAGTNLIQGFFGGSRNNSGSIIVRRQGVNVSASIASVSPVAETLNVFGTTGFYTNARLAFYSIGESLDLALLDARITTLINAFAAAIP